MKLPVDTLIEREKLTQYLLVPRKRNDKSKRKRKLKEIFGREVDLVEWTTIAQSRNYIRRKEILGALEEIYAA